MCLCLPWYHFRGEMAKWSRFITSEYKPRIKVHCRYAQTWEILTSEQAYGLFHFPVLQTVNPGMIYCHKTFGSVILPVCT